MEEAPRRRRVHYKSEGDEEGETVSLHSAGSVQSLESTTDGGIKDGDMVSDICVRFFHIRLSMLGTHYLFVSGQISFASSSVSMFFFLSCPSFSVVALPLQLKRRRMEVSR